MGVAVGAGMAGAACAADSARTPTVSTSALVRSPPEE